jgi:hypothetical protein
VGETDGFPAITLWQPWASLVACGAKQWETRGWRTSHRGPLRIHAAKVERPEEAALVALPAIHDALWPHLGFDRRPMPTSVRERLPRGAIVATVNVVDCCPVGGPTSFRTGYVQGDEGDWPGQAVVVRHDASPFGTWPASLGVSEADTTHTDITNQLPMGEWETGGWGWRLADNAPTSDRCPLCLGKGGWRDGVDLGGVIVSAFGARHVQCPTCEGQGSCDPVPARGMPGIWRWTP